MSEVTVILLDQRKATIKTAHYKEILEMLNSGKTSGKEIALDAGLLLVDIDLSVIFSFQEAFGEKDITSKRLKEFSWVQVPSVLRQEVENGGFK